MPEPGPDTTTTPTTPEETYDLLDAPEIAQGDGWVAPPSVTTSTPCPECGYDLQGTAGFRCPECGTEYETAVEAHQRRAADWYDLLVFRWMFVGLLPMIAWSVIALPVALLGFGVFTVLYMLLGVVIAIGAGLWAAKKVTEELDLATGLLLAFIVAFCTIGANLGMWRGVVRL